MRLFIFLLFISACTPQLYEYHIEPPENKLSEFLHHSPQSPTLISAHRGGRYYKGYPENSIQAFAYTSFHLPAIIECDVRLTQDSVLVLLHDDDLDRTTTGKGALIQQNWEEVRDLNLVDDFGKTTPYKLPRLTQALLWGKDRVIFTLDVKRGVPFEKVIKEVERMNAEDYAAIITYNWKDAKTVHRLNPKLMISIGIRSMEDIETHWKASGIPANRILAFTGYASKDPYTPPMQLIERLQTEGIPVIYGRFGGEGEKSLKGSYQELAKHGVNIWTIDYPLIGVKALPDFSNHAEIKKKELGK